MSGSDLVKPGAFQDRIFAKIKESIGDLMTDEDLKRLVEAAMQDAFFKPAEVRDNYGRVTSSSPLVVRLVDKLLRDRITAAVDEWLQAHSDDVLKLINEQLNAGAATFLIEAFNQKLSGSFYEFGESIKHALRVHP